VTDEATTPAIDALQEAGIAFRVVRTERAGSAEESATLQGIPVEKQPKHCYTFLPGGKNVLEVFGSDSDAESELRKMLESARFGAVDQPSTWLPAGSGFPASAQVGGE
jgi:hypothetical protein